MCFDLLHFLKKHSLSPGTAASPIPSSSDLKLKANWSPYLSVKISQICVTDFLLEKLGQAFNFWRPGLQGPPAQFQANARSVKRQAAQAWG